MPRRVILAVIILAMLTVVAETLVYFFIKPESSIQNSLSEIATDYYENVFYDSNIISNSSDKSLEERLSRYSEKGFSRIFLRQLLLAKGPNHQKAANLLKKHCDEDKTYIQIFPEAPYGRKNYHINYVYSCNS